MTTKKCFKCKKIKSTFEFNKCRTSKDGLHSYCKFCQIIIQSNYKKTDKGKIVKRKADEKYRHTSKGKVAHRKANKKYQKTEKGKARDKRYKQSEKGKATCQSALKRFYIRHPNEYKATGAVNNAIAAGKMPRPDTLFCHYCTKPAQQYHHWHGYEKEHWLDVVPVCIPCHVKCKRKIA